MNCAVSDLHGCYDKYLKLLDRLDMTGNDSLYFLGDIVDRGDGRMQILLDLANRKNIFSYRGNHDHCAQIFLENFVIPNDGYSADGLIEASSFVAKEVEDGILLIDYLQLIDAEIKCDNNMVYNKTSAQRLSEISYSLKCLAQEKKMPIVVCSQLTRALEQRSNKRPTLYDFRGVGEIVQNADGIIFIYRDSYYSNDGDDDAELILVKNCNGETGTAYVKFNRNTSMFENE